MSETASLRKLTPSSASPCLLGHMMAVFLLKATADIMKKSSNNSTQSTLGQEWTVQIHKNIRAQEHAYQCSNPEKKK